jgi:hypothetical protein
VPLSTRNVYHIADIAHTESLKIIPIHECLKVQKCLAAPNNYGTIAVRKTRLTNRMIRSQEQKTLAIPQSP